MKPKYQLVFSCGRCLVAIALLILSGCADRGSNSSAGQAHSAVPSHALPNGAFAVLHESTSKADAETEASGAGHKILVYDQKYSEVENNAPPRFVTIDPNDYVPLVIDGRPEMKKDGDGKSMLTVILARDNIGKMEDFTRPHLGGRLAIVVDGEIVTIHKIRSVIPDGKVQITRCVDNACEVLRSKLAP